MRDVDTIGSLPKAALHDHLDGGVRVETILELADETGYSKLPADEPESLAEWFDQGGSGSLDEYLKAFDHTVAVMQTPEALDRVAYEAVTDLAADGVVYAELRFAPALHQEGGLSLDEVIEATLAGMHRAAADTGVVAGLIPSALRSEHRSEEVATAAARFVGRGAIGFDLAGPETGHPPDQHLPAFHIVHEAGLGVTIHAGESDGPNSIWRAIARCGAQRIGHGVLIVEDTVMSNGEITDLGPLARRIRDHRIPLEIAVRSNIHTGIASTASAHPLGALYRAGFNVSINTDNRLMSRVSTNDEYVSAVVDQGLSLSDLGVMTEAAIAAGFGGWPERRRLIHDVVRPAYAAAAAPASA